jgi:NADH:ubiquinone oxidoreductase subunit E
MSKGFKTPEKVVYICTGSKCKKKGSKDIYKDLKSRLKDEGLNKEIEIIKTECTGRCKFAPVLSIQPANAWLRELNEGDVSQIMRILTSE